MQPCWKSKGQLSRNGHLESILVYFIRLSYQSRVKDFRPRGTLLAYEFCSVRICSTQWCIQIPNPGLKLLFKFSILWATLKEKREVGWGSCNPPGCRYFAVPAPAAQVISSNQRATGSLGATAQSSRQGGKCLPTLPGRSRSLLDHPGGLAVHCRSTGKDTHNDSHAKRASRPKSLPLSPKLSLSPWLTERKLNLGASCWTWVYITGSTILWLSAVVVLKHSKAQTSRLKVES